MRTPVNSVPLSLVAAGAALRLSSWPAVFHQGRALLAEPGDYLHLRRMMSASALFPGLPALDRYLSFPDAAYHRAPPLHDWLVGGARRLLGTRAPEHAAALAAFAAPLAGVAALWLFWRLCERLMERRAALWALAGAAFMPPLVLRSQLGRTGAGGLESLLLIAALAATLGLLDGRARARNAALAAAALAAGAWCSVGFQAFGVLVFLWLLEQRRRESALVFLLQAPLLLPGALGALARGGAFAFETLSLFQPLAALALGLWLLAAAEARERPRLAAALGAGGFAIAMALARLSTASFSGFGAASGAAASSRDVLGFMGLLPLAAPLAWRAWRADPGDHKARLVLVWTAGTGLLALLSTRFVGSFALALCALLAPWAARMPAAALVLALPALWSTAGLFGRRAPAAGAHELAQACEFLRERTTPTRSLWSDQGPPEHGVHARAGLGPAIAALGQRPAAAVDVHWLEPAIERSLALFALRSADEAEAFLRRHGFRYAVLDGFPAAPDSIAERLYAHDGGLARRPDGSWAAPVDALRLVFESAGPARVKVFEAVQGRRISGGCRGSEPVIAETEIEPSSGRRRPWRTLAECRQGRYALRLPYPGLWRVREGGRSRAVMVGGAYSSSLR